jgi:microcystin degradation protein MlrC
MKQKRIAIIGLSVESLIGSPLKTAESDMQTYRGDELPANNLWLVRGALQRFAEESDFEIVPLLWATALPGGSLTQKNYHSIRDQTIDLLKRKGPFQGVLVANHGALEVEGFEIQADADYVAAVRKEVGSDVPIALALDLHGHMTPALLEAATVFSVLRTAPHRDDRQTGYRAAQQLIAVLRKGLKPKTAAVHIPILSTGESAVTTAMPGAAIYAALPGYDSLEGVMEANVLVGFAFNDCPWTGMTALVTCESDAEAARKHAVELAGMIWGRRTEFGLRMETASVADGLKKAASSAQKPVYVSDAGDNTTAGAPGDLTGVLQAVLTNSEIRNAVVAGIYAPKLVERALALGKSGKIEFELGEEHISLPGTRMKVTGKIENGGQRLVIEGFQPYRRTEGAWVSIRIGSTIATFHSLPVGITTPAHFLAMGIEPMAHPIYVVKLGYLHPQLEDTGARHILLLSEGAVDLDLSRRDWRAVPRPVYPVDPNSNWSISSSVFSN